MTGTLQPFTTVRNTPAGRAHESGGACTNMLSNLAWVPLSSWKETAVNSRPYAYKVEDLASVLPIGRTRIFALIKSGELESIKVGRSRLIPTDSVERFLQRLRVEQNGDVA
jgi:excisionase family DNA binding protein